MGEHKYDSKKRAKTYISRSINKHGWDNFKKEIIIDDVPEEDLSNLEISYIEVENTQAPNGMNLTLGGDGMSGICEETRKKISQASIRRQANRDRFGTVTFRKRDNKYDARGPHPDCKHIGMYFSREKAIEALNQFNQTGERMDSDRSNRKNGSIRKKKYGERYEAMYMKNRKHFSKTFDTVEECEEWLEKALKYFNKTGKYIEIERSLRKRGTGSIKKSRNGNRYQAVYKKNKKSFCKTFDTVQECENWLQNELNF
tara:strand:+ start:6870 stop:7640 length:771 start_codon:yes stop_codon:yes gene_type:complete